MPLRTNEWSTRIIGTPPYAVEEAAVGFSGVPSALLARVRQIVDSHKAAGTRYTLGEAYTDAIRMLLDAVRRNQDVQVPAQYTGKDGRKVSTWIRLDAMEDFAKLQAEWGRGNLSNLFIAALQLFVDREDRLRGRKS
jgi:hypothetical protein